MLYEFKYFDDNVIANVIKNQLESLKKMGDSQPLSRSNLISNLRTAISTVMEPSPNNTALRDLIKRCNNNTDQSNPL
jgi:hypothetical protein